VATAVRDLELDLDAFEGPFDLLLTLVLKEQLQPAEVDVAGIVVAFVERMVDRQSAPRFWGAAESAGPEGAVAGGTGPESTVLSAASGTGGTGLRPAGAGVQRRVELDLDACGEFLVLVAALLELKARHLFPDEEAELGDLEPEEAAEELARRLAEYRRMKEAAAWLRERLDAERDRHFRLGPAPLTPRMERRLAEQDAQQLSAALRGLAVEPPKVSLSHMALRFPPVSQFVERFRALLGRRRVFDFDDEVAQLSRVEQAVAFLALLELRKSGEIGLSQGVPFAPIRVSRSRVWPVASATPQTRETPENERISQWKTAARSA
jgi:segregation and condensation protein A